MKYSLVDQKTLFEGILKRNVAVILFIIFCVWVDGWVITDSNNNFILNQSNYEISVIR